jgi:chaperonin GroEL (HSP60 family)
MPYKQLFFRSEAREKIVRGAAALADAVRVTLGPKSKCVLIGKKWGSPIVCNDGVTIVHSGRKPYFAEDNSGGREGSFPIYW